MTQPTQLTTLDRILKGMELLDTLTPDWKSKLALHRLDMSDAEFCILGQVYGDYDAASELWQGTDDYSTDTEILCVEHGFQRGDNELYEDLQQAWLEVLQQDA